MKKKFKDIIPPEKRSIRNIPVPARDERGRHPSMDGIKPAYTISTPRFDEDEPEETHHLSIKTAPSHAGRSHHAKKTSRKVEGFEPSPEVKVLDDGHGSYGEFNPKAKHDWRIWTVAAALVLVAGYFLSAYLARADITINLTKHTVTISDTSVPLNKVDYLVVSGDISKSVTLPANGSEKISNKATGTVVIYNSGNSSSQKLAVNTRLETPDGHIFKTDQAVTVPAVKTSGGKKIAGSVEVSITADQPGEAYNLGLKDFTLAGFKGTANYENFYARSKTPLAGGFVGTVPDVDQTELANTVISLKRTINEGKKALIAEKIKENSTPGTDYVYVPETSIIEYSATDVKQSKDGKSAEVTISAKVTALALSNSALSKYLVESDNKPKAEPENAGENRPEHYAGDLTNLTLSLAPGLTSKNLITAANMSSTNLTVTASGTASITSITDESSLAAAVSHLSRDSALSVIKGLVDADAIEVRLKPWWFSTLPDSSKIRIIVEK